jgi:hypothetical protein
VVVVAARLLLRRWCVVGVLHRPVVLHGRVNYTNWHKHLLHVLKSRKVPKYQCEIHHAGQCRRVLLAKYTFERLHDLHLQLFCLFPLPLVPVCRVRIAMLVKVSECSWPSNLLNVSITGVNSASASFYRPCFLSVDVRLDMFANVEG